jgi:translation initiation factor IF-1
VNGVVGWLRGAVGTSVPGGLGHGQGLAQVGPMVEKFKAGMFSIKLDVGKTILATMAGRLRRNRIKIMNGDRVTLEICLVGEICGQPSTFEWRPETRLAEPRTRCG